MSHRLYLFSLFIVARLVCAATPHDTILGFDGLADLGTNLDSKGVSFIGATVLACGGSLNCTYFPPYSGRNVIYDTPGFGGLIKATFDPAVTGFVSKVAARITGNTNITMTAFDDSGNVLGTAQTGGPNYVGAGSPNILLSISPPTASASIAYVTFHDSGNTYTIDDFTFTSTPSVILLDPGHGMLLADDNNKHYQRPATPTYGLREDNLTLSIANAAKNTLIDDNYRVYMTRTGIDALYNKKCGTFDPVSDSIVNVCNEDLRLRVEKAKRLFDDPDDNVIFVSVHTNGGKARLVKGRTQTYYCHVNSLSLANNLLNEIEAIAPPVLSLRRGGYYNCDFGVIKSTAAEGISGSLIEVLYHKDSLFNNTDDEELLNDLDFRKKAGVGIANAIEEFIINP